MNTNIIRKNAAFFAKYTCDDINISIRSSKFHNELKEADIVTVHKKKAKLSKEKRFMKDAYMIKCQDFLIISFQSISVVFERVTAHNTVF